MSPVQDNVKAGLRNRKAKPYPGEEEKGGGATVFGRKSVENQKIVVYLHVKIHVLTTGCGCFMSVIG